jgi:hypothetical protein
MADRPFTTTLPADVLRELERAATENGMKKKDIIIEAFTVWNKERKQMLLAEDTSGLTASYLTKPKL